MGDHPFGGWGMVVPIKVGLLARRTARLLDKTAPALWAAKSLQQLLTFRLA